MTHPPGWGRWIFALGIAGLGVAALASPALAQHRRLTPLTPVERSQVARSAVVGESVAAAFSVERRVPVIVVFDEPLAEEMSRGLRPHSRSVAQAIEARASSVLGALSRNDFKVRHRYRAINAIAGQITKRGLLRLIEDGRVQGITYDIGGEGGLNQAIPLSNTDDVHALGLSGQGVTVALIDTGVDSSHPDIGTVVAEECFCSDSGSGCCPGGGTTESGPGAAADDHGHGTNIAGIITSAGTTSPKGAAPAAEIVAIKVLDENNAFCCISDVMMALDWIIENNDTLGVDVVNLSLGTFALFSGDCDAAMMGLATPINTLRGTGVLTVASSMNNGSDTQMAAPACIANAVSVGAVWDANLGSNTVFGCTDPMTAPDLVTCFSNSNASTDLFAPGAFTTSSGLGGGFSSFAGTSQAAALVSGCAALLHEELPGLAPGPLEASLETSATWVTDPGNMLSFPRLDCEAAHTALPEEVPALPLWGPIALGALLAAGSLHAIRGRPHAR